ncbi:MAG: hypothetical protein OXG80_09065 [Chloroflexi bacterium]|nr:hypothetical protein [Chloroflexota bacterium]
MYDALEKLWPDSMSEDADTRKGVVALLQSYGFGVDEFLDAGDIRLVRMFSDLQKSQATLKRARQARGNRGAPRIVRKATARRGQAGRRGQQQQQQRQPNRLRNVWMNQGGPEAITVGGEEILAAMRT